MIALSTLYPQLVPELNQCPLPIITQALIQAARDLCRASSIWEEDLTAIASVADQADYTLVSDYAAAVIHQVMQVDVGDLEEWSYSVDLRTGVLTLDPAPGQAGDDIVATVVYQPLGAITELPDYVMSRYGQALVYRVLSRLKSRRNSPWVDMDGSRYYDMMYLDEVADALADEIIDGSDGTLTMGVTFVL